MYYKRYNNNRTTSSRWPSNRGFGKRPIKALSYEELHRIIANSKIASETSIQEMPSTTTLFKDLPISDTLKTNILKKGYDALTPIQNQAIPAILEGKDIIGIANTGTGKTAAFLVPLVEKISKNRSHKVLIITPTRELALQIRDELTSLTTYLNIYSTLCIGGASMHYQKRDLLRNPNFVIGTPGRIKDLIRQDVLNLSAFNNIVLDEADRMVDIGFVAEIKFFISLLPKQRQSLFFSATISPKVKEIINSFVQDPVTISVRTRDTAKNITQEVVEVYRSVKVEVLHDLLIKESFKKTLIFGRTKRGVESLEKELRLRGFKAASIHGDKPQNQRQRVLKQFNFNEIDILLATDVASRGLDINDVSHVINYDIPESLDAYIHRIGRTGRGEKKGIALTFLEID